MRRVVVTGMAGLTSLGHSWKEIKSNMAQGKNGVVKMKPWLDIEGMNTQLGAPIVPIEFIGRWSRKKMRTMGPVSYYSVLATEVALQNAGLLDDPVLMSGRTGVTYGSSSGSTSPLEDFSELLFNRNMRKITSTSYIRMMGHTAAVNIGLFFNIKGRILPTSTACTSGSLAIGYGTEMIRSGAQDIMIAGGAEEICPSMAAVFDALYATSLQNDVPQSTPRPFDKDRDGLVIGEGAATLILEEYEHAKARGASILAEVAGFGTNQDGNHVTQPSPDTIEVALRLALEDAEVSPRDIDLISGHGTATEFGDITESTATSKVFGNNTPFHSLKGFFGHTLGACGSMEAWLGIEMMKEQWFPPTLNLKNVDQRCGDLDFIQHEPRRLQPTYLMSNNFAFGGINTSLIFKNT